MKKYNNILIDENQPITNPKTYFVKIYNQSHEIIGSVHKGIIYDLEKNPWGKISDIETDKVREVFKDDKVIAKVYDRSMLLMEQDPTSPNDMDAFVYVGTIERLQLFWFWIIGGILFFIIILLIILLCTLPPKCDNEIPLSITIQDTIKDQYWHETEENKLSFFNTEYLYPGINGTYQLSIKNTSKVDIKYILSLREENEQNLPIHFQIKINDTFFLGNEKNYKSLAEYEQIELSLRKNETITITFMYCWEEDDEIDILYANQNSIYQIYLSILYQTK